MWLARAIFMVKRKARRDAQFGRIARRDAQFGRITRRDAQFGRITRRDAQFGRITRRDAQFGRLYIPQSSCFINCCFLRYKSIKIMLTLNILLKKSPSGINERAFCKIKYHKFSISTGNYYKKG